MVRVEVILLCVTSFFYPSISDKPKAMIKEACVETYEECLSAVKNGADQLEVCSHMELDGLTPDKNLIKIIKIKETTMTSLNIKESVSLIKCDGKTHTDELEIAQFISALTNVYDILFGKSQIEIDSHLRFIADFNKAKCKLDFLNTVLNFNSFVNGFNITISDIYAFTSVVHCLTKLTDGDKQKFCNVVRWGLHIQSLDGIKNTQG